MLQLWIDKRLIVEAGCISGSQHTKDTSDQVGESRKGAHRSLLRAESNETVKELIQKTSKANDALLKRLEALEGVHQRKELGGNKLVATSTGEFDIL